MAPFPIDVLGPRQAPYLLTTQTIADATTTFTTTFLQTGSPTSTAGIAFPAATTTSSQSTQVTMAPAPTSSGPSSAVVGGAIIGSVLGFLILCVWWCYCGCYLSCFGVQCMRRRKPRWGMSSRGSRSESDYTSSSSPSSGTERVRIRVERRESDIQVPRRAAMRERDSRASVGTRGSRVVYETRRRSRSRSSESGYGYGRGGRKKEPLFPWFQPR